MFPVPRHSPLILRNIRIPPDFRLCWYNCLWSCAAIQIAEPILIKNSLLYFTLQFADFLHYAAPAVPGGEEKEHWGLGACIGNCSHPLKRMLDYSFGGMGWFYYMKYICWSLWHLSKWATDYSWLELLKDKKVKCLLFLVNAIFAQFGFCFFFFLMVRQLLTSSDGVFGVSMHGNFSTWLWFCFYLKP